jgi:hypothetical protein
LARLRTSSHQIDDLMCLTKKRKRLMSKKLIAVASAAALALSALVGVAPANANTFAVAVSNDSGTSPAQVAAGKSADGVTAATSYNVNVPSSDVIRSNGTAGETTALKFDVTTTTARGQVDVTATGGVRLITADELAAGAKVATGKTSLTDFSANSVLTFYAITTSTTAGTVVVSNAGNSKTVYVAGESDWAYKLNLSAPASVALGGDIKITGTVKDAFGNDLTAELTSGDFDLTGIVGATGGTLTYTASTKSYEFKYTAPTTATPVAIQIKLNAANTPTKVTAFGDPVASAFFTVNATDLTAQVAALTAQVAALQAQLANSRPKANSVTKKRYNTLARKWNAAFPSQRVALKK